MATNIYRGNRYVPLLVGDWNKNISYESLSVVCHQGNSFTSKQNVPTGVEITNTDFWVATGNYNAQVEQYRQESIRITQEVKNKLDSFSADEQDTFNVMLNNYKEEINKYADGKYADINQQIDTTNTNLQNTQDDINGKMLNYNKNIDESIANYKNTVDNQIAKVEEIISSIDLLYECGTSPDIPGDDITIIEGGM